MKVYVVTNPELGWDCVCGVYKSLDSVKRFFIPEEDMEEHIDSSGDLKESSAFFSMSSEDLQAWVSSTEYVVHETYIQ